MEVRFGLRTWALLFDPLRIVHLRASLRRRLEQLRHKLAHQIETLPLGNEAWIHTERELVAAEHALQTLGAGER